MHKLLKYIILLPLAIFANFAHADGQLNLIMTLNVIEQSCVVSSENRNMSVDLGRWSTKQFKKANDTSPAQYFEINLESCNADLVKIRFSGQGAQFNDQYLALNADSNMPNIGIQIKDENKNILPLNEFSPERSLTGIEQATLKFYANFISDDGRITAGKASATATFQLYYD
jgi:minor fimbrial subunit